MVAGVLVMFRETLEAVLLAAILLGYLRKSGNAAARGSVFLGIGTGIGASVLAALLFARLTGGFDGVAEQIFEAAVMTAGAILILTLIAWVGNKSDMRGELEKKAAGGMSRNGRWGLFLLSFVTILREGVESVLFLSAAGSALDGRVLVGAAAGFAAALVAGILLFTVLNRIGPRTLFGVTNVILVLFAAGLFSRAAHELSEAGVLPSLVEHLWNLNPPIRPDGSFPALHDQGVVGGVLQGLFGWRGSPSLLELIVHFGALAAAAGLWAASVRRKKPV